MKNFSGITDNLDITTKKYVDDGLAEKANSSDLATVATSGSYNDLSNKLTAGSNISISGNTISATVPTNYVTTDTEQTITSKKTFNGEVKFGSRENFQGYYIKRMIGSLSAGTRYNDLDSLYKDGTYHRMWRLRFPSDSDFWGKIKITLYGGYSSFNASGVMSKSITCNFNKSNIYNNVGCYDGLGVNVEQDFRISEAIWNATASAWEVLIWQKNLNGNNSPTIMLECWTTNNTNYINAFNGIAAQTVELTQSTSYSAQKASSTGGTKTVTWEALPVYENPLGEEIATVQDISGLMPKSGGIFNGNVTFASGEGHLKTDLIKSADDSKLIAEITASGLEIGGSSTPLRFYSSIRPVHSTANANEELAYTSDIPDVSGKANLSGGNTLSGNQVITGYLDIRGTAAEKHLKTCGIGGSDGNGNSSDLYLQYSSDYKTYFGNTAQSSLNADGSISITSGTTTGNLTVGGNLTVNGTTTTVDSTTLQVKDKLIEVAHGNAAALTTPAGLVAPKYDGSNSGGLVFDSTGTAYVGDVTIENGNINVEKSGLQPLATRTGLVGGNLVQYDSSAQTLKDSGKKIGDLVTTDTEQTISGAKTFAAPSNVSGKEQATAWFDTANNGRVGFGKEAANSGTGIFFEQSKGTRRLNFRASQTAGAMVWEQPESGAQLYVDLGAKNSDYHRIAFPSSGGTLALTSQIPTVNNGTLTIQKNGTNVQTFTANQSGNVTANITVPTKTSELTNDSGFTTNTGTITGIKMNGSSKGTSGVVDLGTVITAHQDISGKANLEGGNTFTGKQTLNSPASDGYSIDASGYVKGSWLQAPSTGKAASNTGKVCVFDDSGWIYYRTPAEIVSDGGGATTSQIPDISGKLSKTTYEWNKEFAASSNGAISLGRYNIYDTQLTFDIDSTTTTSMSGKLVIATQNGVIKQAKVFGDATGALASRLVIYQSAITDNKSWIEVFCNFDGWSKNKVHIYGVALNSATVTNQMSSVTFTNGVPSPITSGDTKWNGTIINDIPKISFSNGVLTITT